MEFLVKWRQYTRAESTWEPMEELNRTRADMVEEFIQKHPNHLAIRQWRRVPMQPAAETKGDRADSSLGSAPKAGGSNRGASAGPGTVKTRVVRAKFENGSWSYLKESRGANGRLSQRWYPEHYFGGPELQSDGFGNLRTSFLAGLPAEEVAVIAMIQNMGGLANG